MQFFNFSINKITNIKNTDLSSKHNVKYCGANVNWFEYNYTVWPLSLSFSVIDSMMLPRQRHQISSGLFRFVLILIICLLLSFLFLHIKFWWLAVWWNWLWWWLKTVPSFPVHRVYVSPPMLPRPSQKRQCVSRVYCLAWRIKFWDAFGIWHIAVRYQIWYKCN